MYLLTWILCILLVPKAYSLQCYECLPGSSGTCTDKTVCSDGQQCSALRFMSYAGGSKVTDIRSKSCALPEHCLVGSLNFGVSKTTITSKCCATDFCNSQPAPEAIKTSPNGKKCFTCDGQTCTATLNCEGNEDYCVSTTVTVGAEKVTMKGCASGLFCSKTATAEITGAIGVDVSCCQGAFCNSANSRSAGLLLMVAPLISLVLFS
ncbi:urokinase plasminogen activator surface receptor-like [Embiotoca jacksoni]|uniref:urokinase plasminogen activator surface receptor-like n=1 Tax=Embiotoca jacksoni TaxID=100190 RepID=UPI003704CCED